MLVYCNVAQNKGRLPPTVVPFCQPKNTSLTGARASLDSVCTRKIALACSICTAKSTSLTRARLKKLTVWGKNRLLFTQWIWSLWADPSAIKCRLSHNGLVRVLEPTSFWREKRGSRRHLTTGFSEDFLVAEASHQQLSVLLFCFHWRGLNFLRQK